MIEFLHLVVFSDWDKASSLSKKMIVTVVSSVLYFYIE